MLVVERDVVRTADARVWLPLVLVRPYSLEITVLALRREAITVPITPAEATSLHDPAVGVRLDGQDLWAPALSSGAEVHFKGGSTARNYVERTVRCEFESTDHDIDVIFEWADAGIAGEVTLDRHALRDTFTRARSS